MINNQHTDDLHLAACSSFDTLNGHSFAPNHDRSEAGQLLGDFAEFFKRLHRIDNGHAGVWQKGSGLQAEQRCGIITGEQRLEPNLLRSVGGIDARSFPAKIHGSQLGHEPFW